MEWGINNQKSHGEPKLPYQETNAKVEDEGEDEDDGIDIEDEE